MPLPHTATLLPLTDRRPAVLGAILRSFGTDDAVPTRPLFQPVWPRPAAPRRSAAPRR